MLEKKGCILCVDDEPNILRSLTWLLQREFEVHTATGAREALDLIGRHDFDVIISDQRMPGMSGSELLREAALVSPRAMRILLTGYSDLPAMLRSVNDSEVYRFINKPWKINELPQIVGEAAAIARSSGIAETLLVPGPEDAVEDDARAFSETILVIDDEAAVVDQLRAELGSDLPVVHAGNIADAIAAFAEFTVGIVLADTRVDNTDTTALLRMLKHQEPQIVTVVYTSAADAGDVVNLINQGQIFRFLAKPVKPAVLAQALAAAGRKREQLKATPELGARHSVEPVPEIARQSFDRSLEESAARHAARSGSSLLDRVGTGLKRLFGS
ncbi:MAG: response regulator [Betaproteobacteria bacterium]|nr:response regulator [Betaproteobacteria bacterium]